MELIATLRHDFEVQEIPRGRSDAPLELGTLTLTPAGAYGQTSR